MTNQMPLNIVWQRFLSLKQGLNAVFGKQALSAGIRRLNFLNLAVFAHNDEFAPCRKLGFDGLDVLGDVLWR